MKQIRSLDYKKNYERVKIQHAVSSCSFNGSKMVKMESRDLISLKE